jgi:teichuronic acid biosynthesis glycosyltransferase TuaC
MKILFVGSGNKTNGEPSILIKNQAISLEKKGCQVEYYLIQGKGFKGYLKNIPRLRKKIKEANFDVLHAHYSLSGFILSLSSLFLNQSKKIVSLMGSDTQIFGIKRFIIQTFHYLFWDATIVKTQKMKEELNLKTAHVIPNGVNLNSFDLHQDNIKNTVLFAADPSRKSKNFLLAKAAIEHLESLNYKDVEFKIKFNISHQEMIKEIQSAGCVLLTSLWEGSPNIIKEAMACNRPIVSSDVGDVNWLLQGVSGCFIVNSNAKDVGEGIISALQFSNQIGQTNGRDKLIQLALDSESIADKLIEIYKH